MRDGEGREINFRNAIIIMTSNLASETIVDMCTRKQERQPTTEELVSAIRPELSAHFQPALLARCKVVPFRPLDKEVMKGVVAMKLDIVAQRLKRAHRIDLSISPLLIDTIAESCTALEAGARNADAVIDSVLLPGISRQLLAHMDKAKSACTRLHIAPSDNGEFEIVFLEEGDVEPGNKKSAKRKRKEKKGK
jgi:type VI secretion system protein VasG